MLFWSNQRLGLSRQCYLAPLVVQKSTKKKHPNAPSPWNISCDLKTSCCQGHKKHLGACPLKLKTSVVNIRSTSKTIMLAKAESTNLMTENFVKKIVQIMPRNISWQWKLQQVNWKKNVFSLFVKCSHVTLSEGWSCATISIGSKYLTCCQS